METDSGRSTSVWMATAEVPAASPLQEDARADVCVVGAGIAGMTTAYLLAREGKSVVVLDDGPVAGGETSRTTAHLTNALDDRYYELERLHGERGARLAAESHTRAIDRIEEIVEEEGIDCDFARLDGYLFVPPGDSTEQLGEELRAAHRAGLTEVEYVERVPFDAYDFGAALRFPYQGQFHILKYINGLARGVPAARRARPHEDARRGDRGRRRARTSRPPTASRVTAGAIVVATNTPVNDLVAIHTKQAPYRTYVVGARVPRGSVPRLLLWDTPDPYHYVRIQSVEGEGAGDAHDVLIVGGEDHKTGQAEDFEERYRRLEEWTRERFPMVESVEFRWSGQVMEPVDGLAFIGRNPLDSENVYIATGDSGNGMTHGTIAGMLLTDLIAGRDNEWATLYDPSRKTLRAGGEFLKENLNVAAQYADLVTGGEVDSVEDVRARHRRRPPPRPQEGRRLPRRARRRCTSSPPSARTSAASSTGTTRRSPGTAPATAPASTRRDGHPLNGPAIVGLSSAED